MNGVRPASGPTRELRRLTWLALASWAVYLAITLAGQSLHEEGSGRHSLLALLALFAVAFAIYLAALRVAVRARQGGRLLAIILGAAALFRATMLFSDPIEEIDIYRYLWDGRVVLAGVSPYRYSPAQVLAAPSDSELAPDLARLVAVRDHSPVLRTALERIHFGNLATIYPPVSQCVFALATVTTPSGSSLFTRMTVMKAWFVAFDLATLGVLIALLKFVGRPIGWSVAYGWCPLVLKEIANSGHLDSLAVFLTTLSLYQAVQALYRRPSLPTAPEGQRTPNTVAATAAGAVLALAVGAKIYPVILAPLLGNSFLWRLGWRRTLLPAAAFGLTASLVLGPMIPSRPTESLATIPRDDRPPLPPLESFSEPPPPEPGLTAFAGEWEMNDFLFLIVMENLRPYTDVPPHERAWFSVVPAGWRNAIVYGFSSRYGIEPWRAPFFLSRVVTSTLFVALALALAWRVRTEREPVDWLGAAFLTVAWFWLLLPTLNPWYWTWAVPLLPFARNRTWLALSGVVFLYYLRFWLTYHFPETPVLGTGYSGPLFFDYVVAWAEFGPWFAWLAWNARRLSSTPAQLEPTVHLSSR